MKNRPLTGKIRYLAYALILLQGLLVALLVVLSMSRGYESSWREYGSSAKGLTIYLRDVDPAKQTETRNLLLGQGQGFQNIFVSRIESIKNGSETSLRLSVAGNPQQAQELNYLGKTIVSRSDFEKLLNNSNANSTIGINKGTANSIQMLPTVFSAQNSYVEKLSTSLSAESGLDGVYIIQGLGENRESFLTALSQASGKSTDDLTKITSGFTSSDFFTTFVLGFLLLEMFTLLLSFIVVGVNAIGIMGKLTLLGWGRLRVIWKLFQQYLYFSILVIPIIALGSWYLSGLSYFSFMGLSNFFLGGLASAALVMVLMFLSGVILLFTKSVNAIRERLPKKRLYALGILGYLVISVFVVVFSITIDSPVKRMENNAKVVQLWGSTANYQLISDIRYEGDGPLTNGAPSEKFNQDFYNWYSSISKEAGVYLIQSQYYDAKMLEGMAGAGIYKSVPTTPFTWLQFSPTYLSEIGIPLTQGDLALAQSGVRVYLLPNNLSAKDRATMESFLSQSDSYGKQRTSGVIPLFDKQRKFKFVNYTPSKDINTWSTDTSKPMYAKNPIIQVSTPENLNWVEASSLGTTEFNGYIKFKDKATGQKYTDKAYLAQYGLQDTQPQIRSVSDFINGLRKQLLMTIQLWGGGILIMVVLLILVLASLATVYRNSNREKLIVQKFLGYSFIQRYWIPLVGLGAVTLIELLAVIIAGSTVGIAFIAFAALVQFIIFWVYMSRDEAKTMLEELKGR